MPSGSKIETPPETPQNPKPEIALLEAGLHRKLRERIDPENVYLSREEIQKIIRMYHGNEDSIIRQCLLGASLKMEEAGKMEEAVRFRKLLFAFEAGTFTLYDEGRDQEAEEEGE